MKKVCNRHDEIYLRVLWFPSIWNGLCIVGRCLRRRFCFAEYSDRLRLRHLWNMNTIIVFIHDMCNWTCTASIPCKCVWIIVFWLCCIWRSITHASYMKYERTKYLPFGYALLTNSVFSFSSDILYLNGCYAIFSITHVIPCTYVLYL